ncbi:odorant receptor 22a-like [Drosophila gunungcola]|uniref:odorant receptor 22a-like n=1 Tax=Drosophila gunungcola TaxID=103775 RepID=UPI0022E7FCA1|nr:odorant receptor 22a-like [Drosophila gunungcola]
MISKWFPRIKAKPLSEVVKSRDAFIYLDRAMWTFGWTQPEDKRWTLVYTIWKLIANLLIQILLPISMVVEYVRGFKSFSANEFLSSLEIGVNIYGSSFKCTYTFLGYKKLQRAKRILDQLDRSCVRDEEKLTVRRYVALGNLFYVVYHVMYSGFVVINFVGYLLKGRHAWRMYIPLLKPEDHFLSTSIAEFLLMITVVTMDQCTDVCALVYMLLARCHIVLLKDRLRNLRSDLEKTEDEYLQELTQCVQDHRFILDYVNAVRPVFSGTIFVQFLLIGVVLGLAMINIMFFSTFWTGLGTFLFMMDVCSETFPLCYLCDLMILDCQDLSNCLFHSNWLTASRRYKSTLVYFLQNLQQPITLTAGGVFPICMRTNLSMVKLAFSVVTVIQQFNLAEKFQ